MRNLLHLIVLMSILFSFWSCTNQEDVIEEEKQEEVLLKKGSFLSIGDIITKPKTPTIVVDCNSEYYTIEITYANDVPLSSVMAIRSLYGWHLDTTWTVNVFTETGAGYINQIHDVWSIQISCMQEDPITGECTLCPQTAANILTSTDALSNEDDVELVE